MLTWMDSLRGRSMMRLASFTDEEMLNLIDLAAQLKARRAAGVRGNLLHRKNIALIFEKSSTRTRNSTLISGTKAATESTLRAPTSTSARRSP